MEPEADLNRSPRWKRDGFSSAFYVVSGLASLLVPYNGSVPLEPALFVGSAAVVFNSLRGLDIDRDIFGHVTIDYHPRRALTGLAWTIAAYATGTAVRYGPQAMTMILSLTQRS